jgi:two-component system sensor histidine kinase RpfC
VLLSADPETLAAAPAVFDIGVAMPSAATEPDVAVLRLMLMRLATEEAQQAQTLPALDILVAEDNRTNQAVTRRMLERGGHRVTIVENGEQAVEALEKRAFGLVLMDINMPVMNGFEAVKLHRFASLGRSRTLIYALTADITPETVARCHEAGMDGCLHKPIEQDELQSVLALAAGGGRGADAPPPAAERAADITFDPAAAPLLDKAAFDSLGGLGGPNFLEELVSTYGADALRHIDDLTDAVAVGDAPAFRDVLHSLRSSSANVGARRIFALCLDWRAAELAQIAQQGDAFNSELREALAQTIAEMDAVLAARCKVA